MRVSPTLARIHDPDMATATHYDPQMSVREARARYFADNAFGEDGGYGASWVTLFQLGPLPLGFPNSPSRVRAVRYHDLHHLVTGYDTDMSGEAEISAFELGGGCGDLRFAWFINVLGMAWGLLLVPERTRRAFARGANSRNLYAHPYDEAWLDEPLGQLRARLGVDDAATELDAAQARRYRAFLVLSVLALAAGVGLVLALVWALWALAGLAR